jgi:tyramine---L-glutamate ligase
MKAYSSKTNPLKIAVYEYISGGGYAGQPIPQSILVEGFGMLRCLVADLKAAGHEITVLIDKRLSKLNPPLDADCTIPIFYPEEPRRFLESILQVNDATYIIAPETGQTLQTLVSAIKKAEKFSLNCKAAAINLVANKASLYRHLKERGFPTPKTVILDKDYNLNEIQDAINRDFRYPVICKPTDGAGCSGLSIIKNENQLGHAFEKIKNFSPNDRIIIQEYVKGSSASVSLLSNGKKALGISLNEQNVSFCEACGESNYFGGCIPLKHPLKQYALVLAEKVVESFSGLQGYVGVDLILSENQVSIVDINARLTTSYVGVRSVVGFNVAGAMVNAMINGELPNKGEISHAVCFKKIETPKPTTSTFSQACKLGTVISPPFPLDNNSRSYALICGEGSDAPIARLNLEDSEKRLLRILC